MCGHSWAVCGEIKKGYQRDLAATDDQGYHAILLKEYDSHAGHDGYCENKPVVRRMIAALCAYDDQLLGKVLTKITLDSGGVDLASEPQARRRFEQRIRSQDNGWTPRLLHVLDLLIRAYQLRTPDTISQEHEGHLTTNSLLRWGTELEADD